MVVRPVQGDKDHYLLKTPTFNEFSQAFDWVQRNFRLQNAHNSKPEKHNRDWIQIQNKTGDAIVSGDVVGLEDPLVLPSKRKDGFLTSASHTAVIPDYEKHRNQIGIVTSDAPVDAIGQACIYGVASTKINILAEHLPEWRPFAGIESGNQHQLQSDPDGQAQILWTKSGGSGIPTAGVTEARVLVGSHASRIFQAVALNAAITSGGTGTVRFKNSTAQLTAHYENAPAGSSLAVNAEVWIQRRPDGEWDILFSPTQGSATPAGPRSRDLCVGGILNILSDTGKMSTAEAKQLRITCGIVVADNCEACRNGMLAAKYQLTTNLSFDFFRASTSLGVNWETIGDGVQTATFGQDGEATGCAVTITLGEDVTTSNTALIPDPIGSQVRIQADIEFIAPAVGFTFASQTQVRYRFEILRGATWESLGTYVFRSAQKLFLSGQSSYNCAESHPITFSSGSGVFSDEGVVSLTTELDPL